MYRYFRNILFCYFLMMVFNMGIFAQKSTPVPVNLGLSVKWANMNVGANTPEDYGDYFSWGEVKPKRYYGDYSVYKHFDNKCYHKYNFINFKGSVVDYLTCLESEDDAATQYYGDKWRMPTELEMKELLDSCSFIYSKEGGAAGFWVKRDPMKKHQKLLDSLMVKADSLTYKNVVDSLKKRADALTENLDSMFLPLTGYCDFGNQRYFPSTEACYWTSSLIHKTNRPDTLVNDLESVKKARCLVIKMREPGVVIYDKRTKGFAIRAVYNK